MLQPNAKALVPMTSPPTVTSCSEQTPSTSRTMDNLHTDILWSIFKLIIITNIDEYPLKNACLISHVCGSWRTVMLTSPEIWGKGLALSELQVEQDVSPWRDLVMERTGSAPLFIKGDIPRSRLEWFLEFITPYWARICSIDTKTNEEYPVIIDDNDFMKSPSQCAVLNLVYVGFNLYEAPWVYNLREITLGVPFTTTQILMCLPKMARLEKASLSAWFPDVLPDDTRPSVDPAQRISLPFLKHIHIEHYYTAAADMLQHINANIECSYAIYSREDAITTAEQSQVFSGLLQHEIGLRRDHRLNVYIFKESIAVELAGNSTKSSYTHVQTMDLTKVAEEDIQTYMSRFYCGDESTFETITEVDLFIKVAGEGAVEIGRIFDSVVEFLLIFPLVRTLQLSQQSLFLVSRIYRPSGELVNDQLFPLLEELVFGIYEEAMTFPIQELLTNFLQQRRSCGRPIKKLHFTLSVSKLNIHWGFLEEFDNMEVSFSLVVRGQSLLGAYVCGSGQPEELDMTKGWEDRFFREVR